MTTVRQPIADMARAAVGLLLERVEDRSLPPRRQTFPSELTIRGSTARTAWPGA
ncbi:substrate-binding domain-containing protein [Saccharopolyspora erythraea]|uniref:substrate-binding domain-containing protein n=1 Tax=Saccharopolyspora erythraea TaxID=1836 RepID=UPI002379A978|nr:substrate-binding domain-containing protein [Saccharopolyspora erythraea]